MDIRSIISEDSEQQRRAAHQPPPRQSPVHASPKASHYPHPQPFPSPTATYSQSVGNQAHAYQNAQYQTPPAGRPSVPAYSRPSPAPYPQLSTAVPPTYNAHNHGQPSASPSSASAQRQTPLALTESPMSSGSYSHPSALNHAPPPQSHPTTPLGPPLPYTRSASYMSREPQSPYNNQRTLSNASHGAAVTTPIQGIRGHPGMASSPATYDTMSPNIERNGSEYSINRERERSLSVSPKTKVPSRSQSMESRHASHDFEQGPVPSGGSLRSILHPSPPQPPHQQHPPSIQHPHEQAPPPHAFDQNSQAFHSHSPPRSSFSHPSPKTLMQPSPKALAHSSPQPVPQRAHSSVSPTMHRVQLPSTPGPKPPQAHSSIAQPTPPMPPALAPTLPPSVSPSPQAVRKRKRHDPVPIWAQKANNLNVRTIQQAKRTVSPVAQPTAQPVVSHSNQPSLPQNMPPAAQSNGHPPAPVSAHASAVPDILEPNFANIQPYDDMTRRLMDFLWEHVVENDAAETAVSHFEIEAKLGVLIDRSTNQRLHLPIKNEAVLQEGYFNLMFQSDMSEKYHQTYNKYLNRETAKSNQNPSRVPIKYEHVRQTDSFYELPQAGFSLLPEFARRTMNPRTTKVRVSRDTKTGAILAKIIKAKLANLEMHFPSHGLDVRVSVNLEIDYPGDVQDLEFAKEEGRRQASRVKDRLCYHHQYCEVDLTQVTRAEDGVGGKGAPKTHEVEVELDANAVRKEGKMLRADGTGRYEDLITTFMNHIRELVRTQLEDQGR